MKNVITEYSRASFIRTVVTALMLIAPVAQAEKVDPAPRSLTLERTFDRMAPPSQDISLWDRESGGYDTENRPLWGRNAWVCKSNSSSEHGKCTTTPIWLAHGTSKIPLLFTEKRSGMRVELNIQGYMEKMLISTAVLPGPETTRFTPQPPPFAKMAAMQRIPNPH